MGEMERRVGRRKKKQDTRRAILTAVGIAGLLSVALLAPNALQVLKSFGFKPGERTKDSVRASRDRLVAKGLVAYEGKKLRLTKRGEAELRRVSLADFKLKKPRRWDGKWRMLIFDIPERQKTLRDVIRRTLIAIGFIRLQDSAWVYPYPCEDLLTLLKADFHIGKDLRYLIIEEMEYDRELRRVFGLNQ